MTQRDRLTARCLCGACTFTATPVTMTASVCHCETCRRWAGGALFSVDCGNTLVPAIGTPAVGYHSSALMERFSCGRCGAPLFRVAGGRQYAVMMAFDDPGAFAFDLQVFTDEKPRNYDFANDTVYLTGPEALAMLAANEKA